MAVKTTKRPTSARLKMIKNDPWLEPYEQIISDRHEYAVRRMNELTNNGAQTLSDFASGYLYFGLQKTEKGWVFREWAPNATSIFLVGDFSKWEELPQYELKRINDAGVW